MQTERVVNLVVRFLLLAAIAVVAVAVVVPAVGVVVASAIVVSLLLLVPHVLPFNIVVALALLATTVCTMFGAAGSLWSKQARVAHAWRASSSTITVSPRLCLPHAG